jgi:hypothetical protein
MKRSIRNTSEIIITLALLAVGGTLKAQTEEQVRQFNQERETYFNENLELTAAEKEAFWPVYYDFDCRKKKILEDQKNTFRYANSNADNLSDKEVRETLDKILRLKTELYELEAEYYHSKFVQVLPAKKALKLYKVEWDFRNHLIDQIRDHGQGGPDGKGKGRGRSGGAPFPEIPPPQ